MSLQKLINQIKIVKAMKKTKNLLLVSMILPGIIHSQFSNSRIYSMDRNPTEFKLSSTGSVSRGFGPQGSVTFSEVMKQVNKAAGMTKTGVALGTIANLTLIADVGVLSGELYGYQGLIGIVGATTGTTRLFISFFTPKQIQLAEDMVLASGNSIWNANQIENSLKHIRVAKNCSKAVPLFGLAGIALVTAGISGIINDNDGGYVCWCTGWAFAMAGFTTSIITRTHIKSTKDTRGGEWKL